MTLFLIAFAFVLLVISNFVAIWIILGDFCRRLNMAALREQMRERGLV